LGSPRFSLFWRAHGRYRQTDRLTGREQQTMPLLSVAIGCIYSGVMQPKNSHHRMHAYEAMKKDVAAKCLCTQITLNYYGRPM